MEFDFSKRNSFGEEATDSPVEVILRAFQQRGCVVEQLGKMFRITQHGESCFIYASDTSFTSTIASKIWKNKAITKKILRDAGISSPAGRAFAPADIHRAQRFVERNGTVVVKPVEGSKGIGVSVGVTTEGLADAWNAARTGRSGRVLVERQFVGGHEARYLVIDNECVAVSFRFPPSVVGDGMHSIAQLVDRENQKKVAHNRGRISMLIDLDVHRCNLLAAQGLAPDTVLADGRKLMLDNKANISAGGESYEGFSLVHDSYKRIAEQVAMQVPGSHVLGIDLIALDHAVPASADNYVVLEGNTMAGLDIHMFPDYGTPNDVADKIADSCLKRMAAGEGIS